MIEADNGYLILKVVEKYRQGLAELEEVEEEIRGKLSGPRYAPAIREYLTELRYDAYIEIRPGYVDLGAAPGKDTSWTDPAKLAPVTTTRDEVLKKGKKKKLLWMIPLPGGKRTQGEGDAGNRSTVGRKTSSIDLFVAPALGANPRRQLYRLDTV